MPLFQRLVGLETEYALRYHPRQPGTRRPSNATLFERLLAKVRAKVPAVPSHLHPTEWFLANGGAVHFERIPLVILAEAGLVEGATPECRGPRQLLLYQRAQDLLLSRAAAADDGDGSVTLVKHNRDGGVNFYGSHENYELLLATGVRLGLWRLAIVFLTPVVIVLALAIALALVVSLGLGMLVAAVVEAWRRRFHKGRDSRLAALLESGLRWLIFVKSLPLTLPWVLFLQPLAFGRQRRQLLAFLVSRPILAGAGSVEADGRFGLSPRAPAIAAVNSVTAESFRAVYYFGHVFKGMVYLLGGDMGAYRQLFRRRQRLQITVGDSNMAQTAEYLKIGTTLLVLDAIEAGALADAPRLWRPLRALRTLCADPDLQARVRLKDGRSWTALEIQRFYLDACRRFVDRGAAPHPEAEEVLRLWEEALDALEHDPERLIGKLDWVTKRYLLDSLGPEASVAEKRKLDLRYHELSRDGYYLQLEAAGVAPTLVEPEEVLRAIAVPPEGTPATRRGQLIREYAGSPGQVRATWHGVFITEGRRTRVVRLS